MSDAKRWGMSIWLLASMGIPVLFLGYFGWSQPYWQVPMAALAVHGMLMGTVFRNQTVMGADPAGKPHG